MVVIVVAGALYYGGCRSLGDPLGGSDQAAAIDAGRKAGLEPYWLGQEFVVEGIKARNEETNFHGPENPQVVFYYFLEHGANGLVEVRTYSENEGGWELILDGARTVPATSVVETRVGTWSGELWVVPLDDRPFNMVIYVLHIDGMVILADSVAASTGVPGSDVNPLIDTEKWRRVLEEHLQLYTQ